MAHASFRQLFQRVCTKTTSRFFRDDRHSKLVRETFDRLHDTHEISIPFGLHDLERPQALAALIDQTLA